MSAKFPRGGGAIDPLASSLFIFQKKNIKSRDLEATPMSGATSKPSSDVVCLLLLA